MQEGTAYCTYSEGAGFIMGDLSCASIDGDGIKVLCRFDITLSRNIRNVLYSNIYQNGAYICGQNGIGIRRVYNGVEGWSLPSLDCSQLLSSVGWGKM